jgi:hypothetical protein
MAIATRGSKGGKFGNVATVGRQALAHPHHLTSMIFGRKTTQKGQNNISCLCRLWWPGSDDLPMVDLS